MKVGIDIGGSHIGIGLINNSGEIITKLEQNIEKEENIKDKLESFIVSSIMKLLDEKKMTLNEIELIGIAIPGLIKENKIYNCNNLGVHDFNLVEKLKKHFDTNIQIRNDAKCAAICEKKHGSLKEFNDCVFLCMGTGIGGAVFLQNKLLKPKETDGFELGHMVIQKNGKKCSCGNSGCFESYCSMKNLKSEIINELKLKQEILTSDIIKLIEEDKVKKLIQDYIDNLSIGIANIINIFESEAICFGGSIVYIKDIIIPRLQANIKEKQLLFNKQNNTKFVIAEYGNDAGIIGSVS